MKNLKFFLPLAALGLLASCSNDDLSNPNEVVEPDYQQFEGMYATFNVNLPSVSDTRADSFGGYTEGTANEYDVNNMWLYLFTSGPTNNNETNAGFYKAYQLGIVSSKDDNTNQDGITVTKRVTFQLSDITKEFVDSVDFYGLIVVNRPDGTDFTTPSDNQTFQTWNASTKNSAVVNHRAQQNVIEGTVSTRPNIMMPVLSNKVYFTMTNAPIAYKSNEGVDSVRYLVKLDKTAFATSPAQATTAAGTFYVQRGVAKVEVKGAVESQDTVSLAGVPVLDDNTAKFNLLGWALDVNNTKTYSVQVVDTAALKQAGETADWTKGWFTGALVKAQTPANPYRIWWAEDPNYSDTDNSAERLNDFQAYTSVLAQNSVWNKTDSCEYVLENTMNYSAMQKNQTTRAIFRGEYKIDGNNAVDFVMYPGTDKAAKVAGMTNSNIESKKGKGGKYALNDLVVAEKLDSIAGELALANTTDSVYYYAGGVTYYTAQIRHFNDGEAGEANFTTSTLGGYEKIHTGRYGILRNNAYQLNVKAVKGFGLPEVPPTTPEPDDNPDPLKYNIVLDVKVLDWAIRNHDYILK